MRVVDDTKIPVPNTTDSRQDIQGSLSTGSQAQEGHGFSAVHLASSELSQALIQHLCVQCPQHALVFVFYSLASFSHGF